jgi:large subunit ribosomal protein L19
MSDLLQAIEAPANVNVPELRPGDFIKVFLRIKEGNSERTQEIRGTVIRVRGGGPDGNFTVRRMASNGIGVERTFLMRSPRIERVVIERHSKVRRAQLYYLRSRTGKSARLKQKFS